MYHRIMTWLFFGLFVALMITGVALSGGGPNSFGVTWWDVLFAFVMAFGCYGVALSHAHRVGRDNAGRLMLLLLMIVPSLLLLTGNGCHPREKYDRTPAGWHVHWEEQGTLTTGLHDKRQLYVLFDAAMERSLDECAARVNLPRGYVASKIRSNDALYTLIDNFYFQGRRDATGSRRSGRAGQRRQPHDDLRELDHLQPRRGVRRLL